MQETGVLPVAERDRALLFRANGAAQALERDSRRCHRSLSATGALLQQLDSCHQLRKGAPHTPHHPQQAGAAWQVRNRRYHLDMHVRWSAIPPTPSPACYGAVVALPLLLGRW